MAPILSTAVGVTPQIIDDPRLRKLIETLNGFQPHPQRNPPQTSDDVVAPLDVAELVAVVEPYQSWHFEEQVDLHEWIAGLNAIDACLAYFIQKYPSLLLIGPVKRKRGRGSVDSQHQFVSSPAESLEDVAKVSPEVIETIKKLLRFLCCLLRNSSSKSVFNSVEELADLLAAADDSLSALALETLSNLATPPSLHKQQSPEVNQHTTGLHNSKTASHRRLIALARGWGTRGSGLGLFTCVTTDNSEYGQGALPAKAGELDFSFSSNVNEEMEEAAEDYQLVRIHLSANEIVEDSAQSTDAEMTPEEEDGETTVEASKKRRRVGPICSQAKPTKSTAELFFTCLEKAGGRDKIRDDRLFALLADIRLARAFYSNEARVNAVERRLRALIAILHAHPSQEIMSGYFQAQPELCVELVDLLRPTVSSANVSSAASNGVATVSQDALGSLASSTTVPYEIRMLAVEALTALVARRDGASGALTGSARHTSVLNELGVGKGQYLGLLPTLIRYSLASLGSSFSSSDNNNSTEQQQAGSNQSTGGENTDTLDIGLAFVEATKAPAAPRLEQLERALEFIDSILTLTSAIVSTPTGTSALTDCGLIPALLTTAATDSKSFITGALPNAASYSDEQLLGVKSLLRFITAQAIQILEGAIVTHNNALAAFHDLHGVEVLTSRLSKEVGHTRREKEAAETEPEKMDCDNGENPPSEPVDVEMEETEPEKHRILSSQRVLLFSIVTCLTVVFHQESTSSSATTPSGGAQLRKPELTQALIDIMDDVTSYGGHLASLIATLLSDVLNSDPHVVHHVHKAGIAKSFLDMLQGKKVANNGEETYEPILPPVPELIMALPNVISALALTEDGAKAVKEANPFPSMLRLFHHPSYAMPKSRCLLNEMTAIVGTGLDEVMRHVQSLKPLILKAIAEALNKIVSLANDLTARELVAMNPKDLEGKPATDLENERSCLMQYVLNFGQLLEQILHNEEHCDPFVAAGGLDALLNLFPSVMPSGQQFLSHVSSLSCPSVSTLHHSTAEESLCLAFKCISMRYDPLKLIRKTVETVKLHVDELEESQSALRQLTAGGSDMADIVRVDASSVLEGLPCVPLHQMSIEKDELLTALSKYLRAVSNVQWSTSLLGTAVKTACQRTQDSGAGWSRAEREWKKELSSSSFEDIVKKLSVFHQSAMLEVCRVRSSEDFEKRERERYDLTNDKRDSLRYRLRIVCPEGAVVRDGIEIDSCASVGSMEMGEIAEAFDRCVNSSGILRYRTRRGWVSEMTRGHGREPVAEVISFWQSENGDEMEIPDQPTTSSNKKRIEAAIPDLRTVSASVMARLQTSYSELFNALSKTVVQGVRSVPANNVSFKEGDAGAHAMAMMKMLSSNVEDGLKRGNQSTTVNSRGVAMYLGCMLSHLHACLFEERRERRMVNVPLLIYLMESDEDPPEPDKTTLLDSVRFIFEESLKDFEKRSHQHLVVDDNNPFQRLDRTVAASLPSAISLLRRLMSGSLISSSPASSVLSRIKKSDLSKLVGKTIHASGFKQSDNDEALFSPEDFVKDMHFTLSEVVRKSWVDPRLKFAPPHIVHPFASLIGDIITGLEDAGKKRKTQSRAPRAAAASERASGWELFRGSAQNRQAENEMAAAAAAAAEEAFEPSDESIARLEEMGFSRDHAIDALENSRTNRVEIAMEYALSHPPPSQATIERRRQQREERRRLREERQNRAAAAAAEAPSAAGNANAAVPEGEAGGTDTTAQANSDNAGTSSSSNANVNATDNSNNDNSADAMDVEPSGETPNNNSTEESGDNEKPKAEDKEKKEAEEDDGGEEDSVACAKRLLKLWMNDAPTVACSMLAGATDSGGTARLFGMMPNTDRGSGEGDGEGEALAVVLCSFLLDICQRYPDECNGIVSQVLKELKLQITNTPEQAFYVKSEHEASFASLCHATVLFTRALPKTRVLVLKKDLLHMIVSCVQGSLKSESGEGKDHKWPSWLASALLILDVMAQPIVAATKSDEDESKEDETKSEFSVFCEDRDRQSTELAEMAKKIFAAVGKGTNASKEDTKPEKEDNKPGAGEEKKPEAKDATTNASGENGAEEAATKPNELFSKIPAYFPLIPTGQVRPCLDICLDVLRKGREAGEADPAPPPGVVHAVMLLFLRLLRSPKLSTQCVQMGAAETILSLPYKCSFTGNSGLATLILRRLLEDEQTLQAAMETEIRATITKLHGKRKESDGDNLSAPHSAFTQAVTPLLCRDPVSFLKAFILTLKIEEVRGETVVTLLSTEERLQNQRAMSDVIKLKRPAPTAGPTPTGKSSGRRRSSSQARHRRGSSNGAKSKSPPQRQSSKGKHSSKKHKREKSDKNDDKHSGQTNHQHHHHHNHSHHSLNGTPANHVISLLISNIMASCSGDTTSDKSDPFPDNKSFLWTASLLEILADLVLAVPACASAVQKFRLVRGKDRKGSDAATTHALSGCPSPSKTFMSFLLHNILPQDRWSIKNDQQIWERSKEDESEESEAMTAKKNRAFRLNKVSQTAARLLVALVARPGEGRKRVVSELTFALSGGRLGHSPSNPTPAQTNAMSKAGSARELHALQAWGELCIGLAAPRSNGKTPEGNSSLSFEVIKLMLELGMAHALLFSLLRVRLYHPMAASTCSSLLLPLEVLTRGSVADGVKSLIEKETSAKSSKESETSKKSNDATTSPASQNEGMANEEAMLEEAFHHDAASPVPPREEHFDEDNEGDQVAAEDDDDVDMEEEVEEGDEEISSSSDSESSSGDNSDSESEGEEGEDDEDGSILDDDDDDSDGASSEEMEEVEEGDWNVNYREELPVDNQEFDDGGDDNEMERNDARLDEGWTRIENSGFGGLLMGAGGGRRHGLSASSGPLTARTRGFIDAAEAMIGTLLRTGEIHGDALAEIEGSLGIRIMSNGRSLRALGGPEGGADSVFADSIAARLGGGVERRQSNSNSRARNEVVGTLPHVHQRNQPGAGYSALSGGGRWIETSSMEYVYGGPSVTAGSRNYDLISPVQAESENENHPNISQLDLQLFPGGPASAAHARTQHSLHPLLCGIDLPPVNALVSDLLPHGIRCTRRGLMTTRRPGEWNNSSFASGNCLVLTSNGNIIRSNRSHSGSPLSLVSPSRNAAAPVGWTDDGLPFDATAAQFSSAFESALRDSMADLRSASGEAEATAESSPAAATNNNSESNTGAEESGTADQEADGEDAAADETAVEGEGEGDAATNDVDNETSEAAAAAPAGGSQEAASPESQNNQQAANDSSPQMNASTDGDGVASSLAEGLRLSPRSDTSADGMSATEAAPAGEAVQAADSNADGDATMEEANEAEAGENDEMETDEVVVQANEETAATEGEGEPSADAPQAEPAGEQAAEQAGEQPDAAGGGDNNGAGQPNSNGLVCPPDVDEEVFNSLPVEMQRDLVEQHRSTLELAAQLGAGSSLDPEALAALPEDLRREVMQQEEQERRLREQAAPADPANAQDMDNASFLASLGPDLREEILLTADETFLNSLPPNIIAEAQILRERAATQHRRLYEEAAAPNVAAVAPAAAAGQQRGHATNRDANDGGTSSSRRKNRSGKMRVDRDRDEVVYIVPSSGLTAAIAMSDLKTLLRLMYLLAPVRPARLLQKVFQNFCANSELRTVISTVFVKLLQEDDRGALVALDSMAKEYADEKSGWRQSVDTLVSDLEFPPKHLLGAVPEVIDTESFNPNLTLLRRKQGNNTAASIAANLPTSASGSRNEQQLPSVVATRIVDTLLHLCKNSPRFCLHSLVSNVVNAPETAEAVGTTAFDKLLDLLEKPSILKSSANLEQLLTLLEGCVSPLSHLSKHSEDRAEVSQRDIDTAAAAGKEWMDVPRVIVSQERLQMLCSILRMETCRDASFTKVNTIVRRLCRVDANRGYVLAELASVAHALGADAIRDLKALRIRLDGAVAQQENDRKSGTATKEEGDGKAKAGSSRSASSSVTLSTSTSELKLLRVLQTLQALCGDSNDEQQAKKAEAGMIVTEELVHLLQAMKLDGLWEELSNCLKVVQVLEGVSTFKDDEDQKSKEDEGNDEASGDEAAVPGKKLKNSAAGLLTRFLPSIEAFFVANASSTKEASPEKDKSEAQESSESREATANGNTENSSGATTDSTSIEKLVGGKRLISFASSNKVLLNALVRNNPGLLDKGLRGLVQVPRCRVFLDFDVKRQWFKTQVRRLRQHASRRHGSLRLHIRRKHVFEDAYHQLRLRNADEMRGRLHITFRNEEGVDAGGLSREFFGILAKEIFNPDYALFTSTEDGCTFQPNANSNINPDHLSYFRFVGRIVGKAVADGFLLDAHFTRSLYKHMLGLKPTHHDMEAIDPDYYRNLKTILEYKLEDIGLDLTFSIEDHSFGRNQVIDLIENGRNVAVTEERKAEYVSLVCQHRMTTAISAQIKSYLDGFYELVSPELIAIFNPRELELLISGLPDIDVHDLKKNTDYVGWKATDKEIEWFWNVMFSLSRNEKAAFLQFVTGSSKVPLVGFSELQGMRGIQKFSIHKTSGTSGALMSAHTCFNSLDFPTYKSEEELREKLLYAINEGGGGFAFA
ncbi:Probable E3 ubiquitin-protein ligase hulA [Seminavis robusta]|uniref:HECT-type E3 ubiquitin transferase n=1 Tax=Seminavis robusta TaxID=568900 RepID=A0A9N8DJS7_9STRA|nr:Probable E3 ubiquitin-protein ligase hulA [Seminavis robusta]|eukprot:Sro180_g078710.1 Probable E3 ubiquitin-protein ligase hulA (4561) ;mRNA; r:29887-43646